MLSRQRHPIIVAYFALLLVLFAGLITACTSDELIATSYKTLKISADTYDATMQTVATLYQRGAIDDQVRDRAIDLGVKFQVAHQSAVIALEAYATACEAGDKAAAAGGKLKLDTAMALLSRALAELTAILGKQA